MHMECNFEAFNFILVFLIKIHLFKLKRIAVLLCILSMHIVHLLVSATEKLNVSLFICIFFTPHRMQSIFTVIDRMNEYCSTYTELLGLLLSRFRPIIFKTLDNAWYIFLGNCRPFMCFSKSAPIGHLLKLTWRLQQKLIKTGRFCFSWNLNDWPAYPDPWIREAACRPSRITVYLRTPSLEWHFGPKQEIHSVECFL